MSVTSDPTPGVLRVGPYRIVRHLGRGGMANVFVAEDPDGEQVALKVLFSQLSDDAGRRRFEREAETVGKLDHPNVVRLLGSGVDERTDRPFIALELVAGQDLSAISNERYGKRLTVPEVRFVLLRCARALAHAHAHGVIHRDVKPGNVLVTPEGDVKLSDFGLALDDDATTRLTAENQIVGTPWYVCPEVLLGEPWSPAADLYALGACAYRLLTGEHPFEHENIEQLFKACVQKPAPSPRELNAEVPEDLARLTLDLLHKEANGRPTAEQLVKRLGGSPDTRVVRRLWSEVPTEESGTPVAPSLSLAPQQLFQNYLIEEEIGRGGMGIVYRARHLGLGRDVALKVLLLGTLASPEERRRFLREAESAGALQHPNIVPVLDVGVHGNTTFLTMELAEGSRLGKHAEGCALTEKLRLFAEVCEGIHHAHTRGVIHRDLKPDNIIVDGQGHPRILDFGIAKRVDQKSDDGIGGLTPTGDVLGTPRYMAPEQAAGKKDAIDVRSDVYALGTILYELACGRTPFTGTIREVLHQVHFVEAQPPSAYARVPWEVDAMCLKAVAKSPEERYQSAIELRQDVARYLRGEPVLARRATLRYRLWKWALRNKRAVVLSLVVLLLVGGLLGGWGWTVVSADRERRARIVQATSTAWDQIRRGEYRKAAVELEQARTQAKPDERFALPASVAERIPSEALGALAPEDRAGAWVTAGHLRLWADYAGQRIAQEEASALVAEARAAFGGGELGKALEVVQLAARKAPEHPGVRDLGRELAFRFLEDARQALASGKAEGPFADRRAALERARMAARNAQRLDAQNREAIETLAEANLELGRVSQAEQDAAVEQTRLAHAARLIAEGQAGLQAGDLRKALQSFELALAYDGASKPAREGVREVERRLKREREERSAREKRERADRFVTVASEALETAREAFRKGELPSVVRERYFVVTENLQRALIVLPDHAGAREQLTTVSREFSLVLVEQGYPELSQFILRMGGVDPDAKHDVELPVDPFLVVVEKGRVNIRRAFGGVVRFAPTRVFDDLRAYLRSQNHPRRIVIEVSSRIERGSSHPQVLVEGLSVRIEDPRTHTISTPIQIPFEGGPFHRPMLVDSQGRRTLRPFEAARGLDVRPYVRRVETEVQRLIRR